VAQERSAVESVGGTLEFTEDIVFSSSRLLNMHAPTLDPEARDWVRRFSDRHGQDVLQTAVEASAPLKVLIIGETIIDEYQYCEAIGKSSKEPSLVVRAQNREIFAGGILAVANNATACCDQPTVISQLGEEQLDHWQRFIQEQLDSKVEPVLLKRKDSPTIIKKRYVDGYFFQKLLEVYHLNDQPQSEDDDRAICEQLEKLLPCMDAVIVVDFGHGLLGEKAVQLLCEHAKHLSVNVQANAGNLGYNLLSKYNRADFLCVAQNELRLDARQRHGDLPELLTRAAEALSCRHAVVTRGKNGCLAWEGEVGLMEVPAMATKVVDRVGAGDTFLSCAAPVLAAGAPLDVACFAGSLAGAHAVATVGHRDYLQRGQLLNHATALLK
jgi:rfaE bifunctional protein kinase chain/domain